MGGVMLRRARTTALLVSALLLSRRCPARAAWSEEEVTDSWALTRPSMAMESDDDVDLVYQRAGSDPGLFVATNASGDWVTERVSSGDHWAPTLVVDSDDAMHIVYVSFGTDAGVHYLTNATGSWVDSRLTTTDDVGIPTMVLDGADDVHIVYPASGLVPGSSTSRMRRARG